MNARVIVSFAMLHGGASFAVWLRDRLMKAFELYEVEAVYVDFVASRLIAETGTSNLQVKLDTRQGVESPTGARPIGATRDDWNELFTGAMQSARAAIIVVTSDALASKWCNIEAGQITGEQERRASQGLSPLKIVVLNLVCTDTRIMREVFPTATIVNATRVCDFDKKTEPLLWDRGDWTIDDRAFAELKTALGRLR